MAVLNMFLLPPRPVGRSVLPFRALDKLLNFKQAVGQADEAIPHRSSGVLMILGGLGIEIAASG